MTRKIIKKQVFYHKIYSKNKTHARHPNVFYNAEQKNNATVYAFVAYFLQNDHTVYAFIVYKSKQATGKIPRRLVFFGVFPRNFYIVFTF